MSVRPVRRIALLLAAGLASSSLAGCGQATQASGAPAWVLGECTVDKITADEESTFGRGLIVSAPVEEVTGEGNFDTTSQFELYDESGSLVDSGEIFSQIDFSTMATVDTGSLANSLYVFEGDYPSDSGYSCKAQVIVNTGDPTEDPADEAKEETTTPTSAQVDLRTGVEAALTESIDAQFGNGAYAECGETAMSLAPNAKFTCWFKSPNGAGIGVAVEVTDADGGLWWGSMSGNGVNGTARVPMDGSVSLTPYAPEPTEPPTPIEPVTMGDCTLAPYATMVGTQNEELGLEASAPVRTVNGTGEQDLLVTFELLDATGEWIDDAEYLYSADLDAWAADLSALPTQMARIPHHGMDPNQYTCEARTEVATTTAGYSRKSREDLQPVDSSDWPKYAYDGSADYDICQTNLPYDIDLDALEVGSAPRESTPEWLTISSIQAALRSLNYGSPDPLPVTGRYGPATEKALASFQERRGLPNTGRIDYATWDSLQERMGILGRCDP